MIRKLLLALSLGVFSILLPAGMMAQDDKKKESDAPAKPESTIPTKLPDFSKDYSNSGEISGVVIHAGADSIMIQQKFRVPSGGNRTREETKNYEFKYAEGALARTKVPPMRADAKGKFVKVPANELEPRKKPAGAPGLHIDRTEMKAGDIVTLQLLRPKSIQEKNVTIEDKLVKMAIVTGETTPPKLTREQQDELNKKKKEAEKGKKDDEKKPEEKKKT